MTRTIPLPAIERLGEDPRCGSFSDASRAGEQIGVMQSVIVQRIAQRLDHMLLAHQLIELVRPPFTCKNLI